jgi:flagellar biosynthesis protein FlhF
VDVVKAFSPCAFDRVVLTKLDEAVRAGLVLDVLSKVTQQLSFFTTGQEIPRDIEIADSERLTSLILGEEAL